MGDNTKDEGLKEMVERDRMIVEATVRIEVDDDLALDLVGVAGMLKECLAPLESETVALEIMEAEIVGYDDDEDDGGPDDQTAAGPSATQEYHESILADPEGYLAELHDRAIDLVIDIEEVADVLESRPDMARWVARLRTAAAGLWAMDR